MKNQLIKCNVCLLTSVLSASATVWTVDDDGPADFNNIQAAVDVAVNGDEIVVAPGTYTSNATQVVDMLGKEIWLHSIKGEQVTIIDGEGARRGIYCGNSETSNTIIEGFTITNGFTFNGSAGGMYNNNSSPMLINCVFTGNSANLGVGGGMYNTGGSPTLTNCTFTNNSASKGGGMYNTSSSPTLTDCTFTGNSATIGGGMSNAGGSPTLTNCTITNNTAIFSGGGMQNNNSSPTLIDTTVCGNTLDQINGDWIDNGGNTLADECPVCPDINGDGYQL